MIATDFAGYMLSELTIYNKYSKQLNDKSEEKESWDRIVSRTVDMHVKRFPELQDEIVEAFKLVRLRQILPSMRCLQFAGLAIEINPVRLYNCCYIPVCDIKAFGEIMFLLLSGCGVGFSVQTHHVLQLPCIQKPNLERSKRFLVQDSLEGWSDAIRALMKSYFNGTTKLNFDYRGIRPRGSPLRTAGGHAPGHEGIQTSILKIEQILDRKETMSFLRPIEVYDIVCHIASAVLSGGIRRSAMIALFTPDDDDMFLAKTGSFYETEPQRCYSNNSAVFLRKTIDAGQFRSIWHRIFAIGAGEPGIFLTNDLDVGTNPCCEISLGPYQFCNLVEINASEFENNNDGTTTVEHQFYERCRTAAFIGTLQASYTDFHYLRSQWKRNTEKDALIGVGLTGIASCRVSDEMMTEGACIIKRENERVAKLIGIRKASRCTTLKPSGTTSIVMNTSSGVASWYDRFYYRRLRMSTVSPIYTALYEVAPSLFEPDVIRRHDTAVMTLPMKSPDGAVVLRTEETALDFLERVKRVFTNWIRTGHVKGINYNNVSATCNVRLNEREDVISWLYDNRECYNGITVFPYSLEDTQYQQLPFQSITRDEYLLKYEQLVRMKEALLSVIRSWSHPSSSFDDNDALQAIEMNPVALEPACAANGTCSTDTFILVGR